MTSRLHRKHPTTLPSILPAISGPSVASATLLAVLWIVGSCQLASASHNLSWKRGQTTSSKRDRAARDADRDAATRRVIRDTRADVKTVAHETVTHEEVAADQTGNQDAGRVRLKSVIIRRGNTPPRMRIAQLPKDSTYDYEQELTQAFDEAGEFGEPDTHLELDLDHSDDLEEMLPPDDFDQPMEEDSTEFDDLDSDPLGSRYEDSMEEPAEEAAEDSLDQGAKQLQAPPAKQPRRRRFEALPRANSPKKPRKNSTLTAEKEREANKALCAKELEKLKESTIADVDLDIAVHGTEGEDFPFECAFEDGKLVGPRCWPQVTYMWKASALCHKPLYFEEVELERYGHTWGPCLQPVVSGAHFFGRLPVLPYCLGYTPPCECQYTLGHYRPGNCAPYFVPAVPISLRGGLMQAGAAVGAAVILP